MLQSKNAPFIADIEQFHQRRQRVMYVMALGVIINQFAIQLVSRQKIVRAKVSLSVPSTDNCLAADAVAYWFLVYLFSRARQNACSSPIFL